MTEPDDLPRRLEQAVGEAIEGTLSQHEGSFVTKWVALIETVGADGDRGLWTFTSPDVMPWDTVGLLQHGLNVQQAQVLAGYATDDDED